MCLDQKIITQELPKRPPIGANTTVPKYVIVAYSAPQAQPLPQEETNPLAWIAGGIGGAIRWAMDVMFGPRNKAVR